jgi:tetratricopeptide (TPR) repeat protein
MGSESAPTSVKEIWEKTIVRFHERTGQKLDGVSRGPDDLQTLLDAHYAAEADDKSVSQAKAVGFQMIHCIQLLGGIASQGASMVFAPAGLCFNALSFLLDIPKKVHEFHGEIDAIFAEVGPALAQYRIYERMEESSQIDEALRLSIYQVMTSFVNLCADCINIHHEGRWKGFKRNAKRILLDDGSVQGQLAHFKKLTQDQLNIQATLTLEVAVETGQHVKVMKATTLDIDTNTKAIKSDVSGLVEAENKRTVDDNRKQILSTIKTTLGQKDDKIAAVLETRDTLWEGAVKDSGKWLDEIDAYNEWINRSSAADFLLLLTGENGTGKSFLVSAIAQDIKSENLATKAERSLIGYYSFSRVEKRDKEGDRQRPEAAIKSICVQLAEQDIVYARRISNVCGETGKNEKYFRDASCTDLWVTLGIGMPTKNTTHYILLDSVGTLSAADRERLMRAIQQRDQGKSSRVRVLLSGEPGTFQGVQPFSSPTRTIDITKYNKADIKAFIVEELKRAGIFQGADEDSQRRKRMVEERLWARSNNSYLTIQQDLRKVEEIIASGGTEEELNRVLHESSTDPQVLVRSEIEGLEAMLKAREIEEINELLIWAVAGDECMTLEELEAALFLRFKTVSLQPLDKKITGKYSKLFTLTFGKHVAFKDHVRDCVVAQRDRPRQSVDDPKITATISITNGDLKLVQRFFWDLNHYSFLGGFAFQPASEQTNAGQRKIQVYKADAHLEAVKRAFDIFLQPKVDERGKALGSYLMRNITTHLKALSEVTGLDELQPADKQFIGSHVYEMFNEGDLIQRNWEFCDMVYWYDSNDDMEIFWSWLDDPVAIAGLGPRDKRWLADLKKDKHRNSSLLTPIMTMVARNWLQKTEWDTYWAFRWIKGFLTLGAEPQQDDSAGVAEQVENSENGNGRIIINDNESNLQKIAKSEQWCKQSLGVTEADYIWCIRLGDTYAHVREYDAASEQYKKAATILQAQDPVNKEQLRDVFKALGEFTTDPERALEYLKEANKLDEENVEILCSMLQRYVASKKEDEARSIVQKAVTERVPGTQSTLLMAMLATALSKENEIDMLAVFKAVFSVVSSDPELRAVFQHEMELAIATARAEGKNEELAILLFQLGSAGHYLHKDSPEQLANAAGNLRECLDIIREKVASEGPDRPAFINQSAADRLSMVYLDRAMQTDGEESEADVERLRQIHEDDPAAKGPKSALASLYTFKGQRDKARDIFRADIIEAFNILADDNIFNDLDGFIALRNLLNRTGDYENALRAALLLPELRFDDTVLKTLLAREGPSMEAVSEELVQIYHRECSDPDQHWQNLTRVWQEANRLELEALSSERAACYRRAQIILAKLENGIECSLPCNTCNRYWDYGDGLHACKYCYNVFLCNACWNELRSGKPGKAFVCSSTHDWYELPPWTMEKYLHAFQGLVLLKTADGGEELVSVSKWLGALCEEWGLSKADWNFE